MDSSQQLLESGAATLGIHFSFSQLQQLLAYLDLMKKWNAVYNLTAITDRKAMVTLHLLDSLTIVPHIDAATIIDVGSGAGLPVIPLAINFPDKHFVALDSNSKRTRFITQVILNLGIANVTVIHARAEDYHPPQPFDIVITRAFSSLEQMLAKTTHLCRPGGRFLAMKGSYPGQEVIPCRAQWPSIEIIRLKIPTVDAERHLVKITKDVTRGQDNSHQ